MSDLVYRLRKRAEIRRQIPTRRSVQQGEPDRIADLLEEAANALEGFEQDTLELLREYAEHTQNRLEFFPLQYESEKFEQVAVLLERYWAAKRSQS